MKLLLTFLLLLLPGALHGQRFSAGIRAGAAYWPLESPAASVARPEVHTWDQMLCLRYESRSWLTLELTVSHWNQNLSSKLYGEMEEFGIARYSDHAIEYGLTAFSRFTHRRRKLQQYVGWSVSYGEQYWTHRQPYLGGVKEQRFKSKIGGAALAHQLQYYLFPRLDLSLRCSLGLLGGANEEGLVRLQSLFGLAYTL